VLRLLKIICLLFVFFSHIASSQDLLTRIINLEIKSQSSQELLTILTRDYNIPISYSANLIPADKIIYLDDEETLKSILDKIIDNEFLDYKLMGKRILIIPSKKRRSLKYTFSGKVNDGVSGQLLIGANISVKNTQQGTNSNDYGFFSITLPKGQHTIQISHVGYLSQTIDLDLNGNHRMEVSLIPKNTKLEEVLVSSYDYEAGLSAVIPGVNILDDKLLSDIPYFLGEVDVLQGALTLPGVTNLGEDAEGLNIRGGVVDENLILLDDAVLYNVNHFYGLISIFNPEIISKAKIYKGNFPSSNGGRTSGLVHVRQRKGNDKELKVSGGIGFASGKLTVEGPIKKENSSFLISGRSSYLDLGLRLFNDREISNSRAIFQDFNTKLFFDFDKKNDLSFSAYFGNDRNRIGFGETNVWGNRMASLQWSHIHTPKHFTNVTSYFSNYTTKVTDPREAGSFTSTSRINDYAVKADHSIFTAPNNSIHLGISGIFHRFKPGDRLPLSESVSTNPVRLQTEHALEYALYASNEYNYRDKLLLNYGVRFSGLLALGKRNVFVYRADEPRSIENIIDTLQFNSWEVSKHYSGIEPRLALNYKINPGNAFKMGYSKNFQYISLISNTLTPSPTDIWKLSDTHITPTKSHQLTMAFNKIFNGFDLSIEGYYKRLDNIVEFKDGANLSFNRSIETEVVNGRGRAYGLEFYLKKSILNFTGWISYTFSRSEIQIDSQFPDEEVNNGEFFPANNDRKHDLSITGIYKISERWSVSGNFIYNTGRPITLPSGKIDFENFIVPKFESRNNGRLTDYHRFDLSFRLEGKKDKTKKNGAIKKKEDYWTFSIYNVYNRKNAFSFLFRQDEENPTETDVLQYSILGSIIPSVTYNFRF